ncbi:MAG: ABC transporter permease [Solirubrobacterales bacterium]
MRGWRLEKRTAPSAGSRIAQPILAVIAGFVFGAIVLAIGGHDIGDAYKAMWEASFGTGPGFEQVLVRATPLLLCGLAVTVALRMNIWNIGAEGQMAMGAIGATFVAYHTTSLGTLPILVAIFLGGAVAAGLWALIAAIPRALIGLNEIIVTLFLNYIALLFLSALINGPWKDHASIGQAYGRRLPDQASLPLIGSTQVTIGVFIALAAAIAIYWLLDRSRAGFSLQIAGGNVRAAKYLGLGIGRRILFVLFLSGAVAGIAGVIQLTASGGGRLQEGLTGGYGYIGILVAFLARTKVQAVVVVAVLYAALLTGGTALQSTGIPSSIAEIIQASIIIFVLIGQALGSYKLVRTAPAKSPPARPPAAAGEAA